MKKFILLLVASFLVAAPASAQLGASLGELNKAVGSEAKIKTGLSGDLGGTIGTVVTVALSLVGSIFLLLTIYAGITWMLARGDETEVKKAQDIVKASIIGLVIVLMAYALTYFLGSKLSGSEGGGAVVSNPNSPCKVGPGASGTCGGGQDCCAARVCSSYNEKSSCEAKGYAQEGCCVWK